jgi:hypothetical protein
MKKKYKYLAVGLLIAVAIMFVGVPLFLHFTQWRPPTTGQFQVHVEAYVKDAVDDAAVNAMDVDLWIGDTFMESDACDSAGKLEFGNMYWVGETVTLQIRDDVPGSLSTGDFYIGAPIDIVVPTSGEAGDTVSLGVIYGLQIAASGPTIYLTVSNGTSITTGQDVELSSITHISVQLSGGISSGEAWGMGEEVVDLRTSKTWVGGLIIWKSATGQGAIVNAKWSPDDNTYVYYIIQIPSGTYEDDPNVDTDGTVTVYYNIDGNLSATTSTSGCSIDAVDQMRLDQLEDAVIGNGISTVTAIAFGTVA